MKNNLHQYLEEHAAPNRPILVGLSGGPDSLVLLDILLELKDSLELQIGIAHVNHNWRTDSTREAEQLQQLAKQYGLPFHLKTLNPEALQGNLEESCRQERLQFFKELCVNHGYQAVLLGHHADDQVESLLKRLFEGSELSRLSGMSPETVFNDLKIWRPLLSHKKADILNWIKKRELTPFIDITNEDERFLRAKFRQTILPFLNAKFGKNVANSLLRLNQDALELENYLDENTQSYLKAIVEGPFGVCLDLSDNCPSSSLELRHLLRRYCEKLAVTFSRSQLDLAVELILAKAANKEIYNKNAVLQIDRKRIFLLKKPLPEWDFNIPLEIGIYTIGCWQIEVALFKDSDFLSPSDWRSLWQGKVHVVLNAGNYRWIPAKSHLQYSHHKTLNKWWNDAKVPAFLRYVLPVVSDGTSIEHEFLSGKRKIQHEDTKAQRHKERLLIVKFSLSGV